MTVIIADKHEIEFSISVPSNYSLIDILRYIREQFPAYHFVESF